METISKLKLLLNNQFTFAKFWILYFLFVPSSALYVMNKNFHHLNPYYKKMIFSQIWYYNIINDKIVSFASDKIYHNGIEWLARKQFIELLPKSQFKFKQLILSKIILKNVPAI